VSSQARREPGAPGSLSRPSGGEEEQEGEFPAAERPQGPSGPRVSGAARHPPPSRGLALLPGLLRARPALGAAGPSGAAPPVGPAAAAVWLTSLRRAGGQAGGARRAEAAAALGREEADEGAERPRPGPRGEMASYVDNSFRQAVMKNPAERTPQDLEIVYSYLHGMEALSNLREHQLRLMCETVRYERHEANEVLYYPDDIGTCWYILLSGSVFIKESMFLPRSRYCIDIL